MNEGNDSVMDATRAPAHTAIEGSSIADELEFAPLANLRGSAESPEAKALVSSLAERYPRKPGTRENPYARVKTKVAFENAIGAFLGELLAAHGDEHRGGWIRCSLDKEKFKGQRVKYRQFDNVRHAWNAAGLIPDRERLSGPTCVRQPWAFPRKDDALQANTRAAVSVCRARHHA